MSHASGAAGARAGARRLALAVVCFLVALASGTHAFAADVRVMSAGNIAAALLELAAEFERVTGHRVVPVATGTGTGANSLPNRIRRGEPVDVLLSTASQIDDLAKEGHMVAGSRVDLARSRLGIAVRSGVPTPRIQTLDDLTRALLAARSLALSVQVSGVFVTSTLLPRLGIADQVLPKVRKIEVGLVSDALARGDADFGIQQISELFTVPGIDYIGPLPEGAQLVTLMSGGIAAQSTNREAAGALLRFLASPAAAATLRATGLEPLGTP